MQHVDHHANSYVLDLVRKPQEADGEKVVEEHLLKVLLLGLNAKAKDATHVPRQLEKVKEPL